jgi:hypothetical protein
LGGKPHEATAILQDGFNIALRKTILGGEMGESEGFRLNTAALSPNILNVAGGLSGTFSRSFRDPTFAITSPKRAFIRLAVAILAGRASSAAAVDARRMHSNIQLTTGKRHTVFLRMVIMQSPTIRCYLLAAW